MSLTKKKREGLNKQQTHHLAFIIHEDSHLSVFSVTPLSTFLVTLLSNIQMILFDENKQRQTGKSIYRVLTLFSTRDSFGPSRISFVCPQKWNICSSVSFLNAHPIPLSYHYPWSFLSPYINALQIKRWNPILLKTYIYCIWDPIFSKYLEPYCAQMEGLPIFLHGTLK